jgi:hypothetical protein
MLPPISIGIFGEYEEKRLKMIEKMEKEAALLSVLKTIDSHPDPNNVREQVFAEELLKIVLEKFEDYEETSAE